MSDHAQGESTDGLTPSPEDVQRIREMYRATLSIPSHKQLKQMMLCPVGLVGAGKTTVVKPLSERLGLVRISTDEIRKLLKENGYNYVLTQEIGIALVIEFLGLGYSVALDADCAGETARAAIAKAKERFGIQVVWIHINPPESFIINKLKNYNHTWLFKDADHAIANYMRRKPLHEHLDMPFLYTFDTSRADLSSQIDEAIEKIEATVA